MSDNFVTLCEVGPRDGLQNEAALVPVAGRVRLINLLSATGLRYIEAASFVSPKWIPQMAGGREVLGAINRVSGVTYAALTPNQRGFEEAVAAGTDEIAVFASASETFSQKNIKCSIADSLVRYRDICARAKTIDKPVRGYVSCAVACPYEGRIAPESVRRVADSLLEMGCREISLGDTIGVATPGDISTLLDVLLDTIPAAKLAGHFHDTSGRALDCIATALGRGLRVFDCSVGGTGGCPFAPGAKGNVATEKVVVMLEAKGFATGIDMIALAAANFHMMQILKRAA